LELDKNYAPFALTMLEDRFDFSVVLNDQRLLQIGGKIDRADEKEESVRVIDYKTGADKLEFAGIDSLFARNTNRNKAAFQTFLYAHAYQLKTSTKSPITPGLFNRTNLFSSIFAFGLRLDKQPLTDIAPYQTTFASLLKQTLEDLYDPSKPFQQTTHHKNCEYCSYRSLCRR
jgi:PD-(D/E)XK nuclease superfamily